MLGLKNTDLLDTLYGGIAGEMCIPNIEELFKLQDSNEDSFVPDAKQSHPPPEQICSAKPDYEIIPTCEISTAQHDPTVDIRPRIWDAEAKSWPLLDTGSQASVLKPLQSDRIDPSILLETVNGQGMNCYGKRPHSIQIGRKMYHIEAVISDTTDNILGMDFISKYKFEFRWGEFGDLLFYDPKAQISTPCQFVKVPKGVLPRVAAVTHQSRPPEVTPDVLLQTFAVASLKALDDNLPQQKQIPLAYKKLLEE